MRTRGTCSVQGCARPHEARGWCQTHYYRFRTHGDPLKALYSRISTPTERLVSKTLRDEETGCLLWTGALDSKGYGAFYMDGRNVLAHRASYLLLAGQFDQSLDLDHLCGVTRCVEPAHLEPVTHAENMRRAVERRTRCRNGHEYTEANTYVTSGGWRNCRACTRAAAADYRARRSA